MNLDAEQALFDACLDADAAGRERLLEACPDIVLRERVRRLLAVHDQESPSADAGLDSLSPLAAPRTVGPYRILERLGEGAMGEVYLAEQLEPVRRRVALKILKFGLSTREVIARFALERQALAMLAHPNIASILDAGVTGDGRPYFAMEYVGGTAITRYCDERGLSLEERLALFEQVCAGVQHAHLRGIIHRDLKPSNILVTEIDGKPACHIIDFGIAKATTTAEIDADAYTRIGHLLGTPEYMSPEQAQLSPLDIDVRTDVYSLGIVLYELLTGSRPYAVTRDALTPEVLAREIANREPSRPSARMVQASADEKACATRRGLSCRALAARLRGDLDWIVLKAIEKDRNRRYSSAQELAADLERHARNEAVLAGPPSWSYRTGRFVRRHRFGVAAAASLFLAAILFGFGMAWLARETAHERDRANAEAEIARRVTEFTAGLFELANPASVGASGISARELLDAGVRRLEAELSRERPETRAALLEAAGNAYRGLGEYVEARRLLREAVALRTERAANEPAALAGALLSEAGLLSDQGSYEPAESVAREAVKLLEQARQERRAGGRESLVVSLAAARLELAEILRLRGLPDEAASIVEQVIAVKDDGQAIGAANRADALYELGRIRVAQGRLSEAKDLLARALELRVESDGEFAESTMNARNGLADAMVVAGESAEAERLMQQNVDASRRIYGEVHPVVGIAYNDLGNALSDLPERYADAEQAYLRALDIYSQTYGLAHPEVATAYNNLGSFYLKVRQWQKAADAHRKGLDLRLVTIGPGHADTASSKMGLALALNKLEQYEQAELLEREAYRGFSESLGADHWRTANARYYLGVILQAQGKLREAEREIRPAHEVLLKALGADHPRTRAAQKSLAELDGSHALTAAHP